MTDEKGDRYGPPEFVAWIFLTGILLGVLSFVLAFFDWTRPALESMVTRWRWLTLAASVLCLGALLWPGRRRPK